jgi:hypothetical protein
MNVFDHKDLGNHLLQLCLKVVKHPVYMCACARVHLRVCVCVCVCVSSISKFSSCFSGREIRHNYEIQI